MIKDDQIELAAHCKSVARLSGAFAAAIGLLVACGWLLDIAALRSLIPGFPEMKFNAALCFMLCGASLASLASRPSLAVWGRVCASLVVLVGGLTMGEYLVGHGLGIDQLVIDDRSMDSPYPGRIPMTGAFNFTLVGLALLAIDIRWPATRWPAQWLAWTVASVSFVVIIGFAYEVSSLYRSSNSGPVALHGVIAFLVLSMGLLLARPDRGLVAAAVAPDAGGLLIRRLLPAVLLLPLVLGWIRLQGERAGFYGTELGLAVYVTSMVGVLSLLVWSTATMSIDEARAACGLLPKRRPSDWVSRSRLVGVRWFHC